jgi:DNA-binding beta-propeller fold protein YncE
VRREAKAPASGTAGPGYGGTRSSVLPAGVRFAVFALLGLALLPLALATPASAALKYQQTGTFTKNFNFLLTGSVAVNDHNNHIYVADSGNGQVYDFTSPTDTSPTVWNGSNTPHGFFGGHVSVAVDNTSGDVYVADANHNVIDKFDDNGNLITSFGDGTPSPNGQLVGTATPDGFFSPNPDSYSGFPIAVSQATQDLYVADANHQVVDIFDQEGAYLRQIVPPAGLFSSNGANVMGIAVNANSVYVSDWGGPNLVFQFDSSGNYVRTLDGSNTPDGDFSPCGPSCTLISVATQDSNGKLFVGAMDHGDFDIFDSSGNFVPPQGFLPNGVFGPSGIAVDQASGDVYLETYGTIYIYKPVVVPDLTINPASNSTATTTTLSGHVDPAGGGDITDCHFEYIDNSDFVANTSQNGQADPWTGAKQAPCTTNPASSLPYSNATDVSADATGLAPGTGYHVRLTVVNASGNNSVTSQFASVGRYQFTTDFGSAGSGTGQLANPQDVAVDNSSGDLYVADTGNHRVVKFDSAGNFISAWGWGVSDGNAASEVCTSSCQPGIAGSGAGQFTTPTFIEVDNSASPSAGDVYVADTADNVVQKFDPSGNLITSWGTNGATTHSGGIAGVAVSSGGGLIVQPGSGNGIALDSADNVITGTLGYSSPGTIAIDTSTNDRYYGFGTEIDQHTTVAGCNPSNPYISCPPTDLFGVGNLHSAAGLTINPSTGVLYVANAGDNNIAVFSPLPLPTVTTEAVDNPGSTSATLTGHVDPQSGGNVVDCHFEYGTDTTYSLGSVPCSPGTPLASSTDVSADITGLTPFATYHYRLVAIGANDFGLPSYSRDRTFTPGPNLPPVIDATSFSSVTPTTVTLGAQINPSLAPTNYIFQYGTDTGYGFHTIAGDSIGSDGVDHAVSNAVSDLQPATTYHFRVVAVNLNGVVDGPDRTFITPAVPAVAGTAASGVTQTTANLSASIRPGYRPTTYHFEYGLTDSYGSSTPESASIGTDNSVYPAGASISGLAPLTSYHFRVVATNTIGTTSGPDQTFSTAAASTSVIPPPPPPPLTCKKGFVKRHGKCVKLHHHKRRHHRRSH